jgi:hypothetical protein
MSIAEVSDIAPAPSTAPCVPLNERLEAYRRDGFTIFKGLHPSERLRSWVAAFSALSARAAFLGRPTEDLTDLLEHAPELFLPAAADCALLDFAEAVMGPRVQLDSIHFRQDSSRPHDKRLTPVHWHRDMNSIFPPADGVYLHPFAVNCITYPNGLNDDTGPFRVIPGSHRRPMSIPHDERTKPHGQEILVRPEPGDVIFTHNGVWHSGTHNVSGQPRWFVSVYYHVNWLPPRDNHHGPNVTQLRHIARQRGDRRLLRLLGEDDRRLAREHATGMEPEEQSWARWLEQERKG